MAIDYDPLIVCVDYRLDGGGYVLEQCGRIFRTGEKTLHIGALISGSKPNLAIEGSIRLLRMEVDGAQDMGQSRFESVPRSSLSTLVLIPFSPVTQLLAGWYLVQYHVSGCRELIASIEVRDKPWEA